MLLERLLQILYFAIRVFNGIAVQGTDFSWIFQRKNMSPACHAKIPPGQTQNFTLNFFVGYYVMTLYTRNMLVYLDQPDHFTRVHKLYKPLHRVPLSACQSWRHRQRVSSAGATLSVSFRLSPTSGLSGCHIQSPISIGIL